MRGGPGGGTDCAAAKIAASNSRARFLRMITSRRRDFITINGARTGCRSIPGYSGDTALDTELPGSRYLSTVPLTDFKKAITLAQVIAGL